MSNTSKDFNHKVYESDSITDYYAAQNFLFQAETEIFEMLGSKLAEMKVLDVGIGGGRTTYFLGPKCKQYLGIDYSEHMVQKAIRNFPQFQFLQADARDLNFAQNDEYDFVFFSYNGIDSVSYEDRNLIFKEFYRVLKPGGFLSFSSHNMDYKYFDKMPWKQNLPINLNNIKHCIKVFLHLPRIWKLKSGNKYSNDHAVVIDEAHFYNLYNLYIRPSAQRLDLEKMGYENVEFFHKNGGKDFDITGTDFVYYLCEKK